MGLSLAYILPKYEENSAEHFHHTVHFLEELQKSGVDVYVFIEKGQVGSKINVKETYHQVFLFPLFRFFEIFLILLKWRLCGVKNFYVHYSYWGGIAAPIITKSTGGKTYYWNCGLPRQYFLPFKLNFTNIHNILGIQIPLNLSLLLCDYVVTGSQTMKKYYNREFGVEWRKILIVPNDIDVKSFSGINRRSARKSLRMPSNIKIVLFVHHLSKRKGAHKIIPIFEKVRKKIKNLIFLVVGDGPEREHIATQIRDGSMGIWLVGSVPNYKLRQYYAASDIFLMPSDEEGTPRVLLEAMASGLPFVASDVGGVRDICGPRQKKHIHKKDDVVSFAKSIIRLFKNKEESRALTKENEREVEKYDTSNIIPIFKNILIY